MRNVQSLKEPNRRRRLATCIGAGLLGATFLALAPNNPAWADPRELAPHEREALRTPPVDPELQRSQISPQTQLQRNADQLQRQELSNSIYRLERAQPRGGPESQQRLRSLKADQGRVNSRLRSTRP
jgi:hypothetical protein